MKPVVSSALALVLVACGSSEPAPSEPPPAAEAPEQPAQQPELAEAPPVEAEPAGDPLERGHAALKARRYADAVAAYEPLIDEQTDLATRVRFAEALMGVQRFSEARAQLDLVLARSARYARGYVLRGTCHLRLSDLESAVADYDRALELKPDQPFVLEKRAEAAVLLDDGDRAFADLARLVELEPTSRRAEAAKLELERVSRGLLSVGPRFVPAEAPPRREPSESQPPEPNADWSLRGGTIQELSEVLLNPELNGPQGVEVRERLVGGRYVHGTFEVESSAPGTLTYSKELALETDRGLLLRPVSDYPTAGHTGRKHWAKWGHVSRNSPSRLEVTAQFVVPAGQRVVGARLGEGERVELKTLPSLPAPRAERVAFAAKPPTRAGAGTDDALTVKVLGARYVKSIRRWRKPWQVLGRSGAVSHQTWSSSEGLFLLLTLELEGRGDFYTSVRLERSPVFLKTRGGKHLPVAYTHEGAALGEDVELTRKAAIRTRGNAQKPPEARPLHTFVIPVDKPYSSFTLGWETLGAWYPFFEYRER